MSVGIAVGPTFPRASVAEARTNSSKSGKGGLPMVSASDPHCPDQLRQKRNGGPGVGSYVSQGKNGGVLNRPSLVLEHLRKRRDGCFRVRPDLS